MFLQLPAAPASQPACIFNASNMRFDILPIRVGVCATAMLHAQDRLHVQTCHSHCIPYHCEASTVVHHWRSLSPFGA